MKSGQILLVLPLIVAFAAPAAQNPPPQPLHQEADGHWTPYEPPTEFPPEARVHTIAPGDTLWALASGYLGDPYLWPQIWEKNPYVRDSHWIYPGDPMVIDFSVVSTVIEEPVEIAEVPTAEPDPFDIGDFEGTPYPLGIESDVYCFGEVHEEKMEYALTVASAERIDYQLTFSVGDVVYLDGGVEEGLQAGDRFFVIGDPVPIRDPDNRDLLAWLHPRVAQVKVICAQDGTSIAEIVEACDPVHLGSGLKAFEPIPLPLVLEADAAGICDAPNGMADGRIVFTKDRVIDIGEGHVVVLDLGAADGLYPGQFATIYRNNRIEGMPRILVGELGILTVDDTYSTAVITNSTAFINHGDRVEMR